MLSTKVYVLNMELVCHLTIVLALQIGLDQLAIRHYHVLALPTTI
jgi:hypothetical protein